MRAEKEVQSGAVHRKGILARARNWGIETRLALSFAAVAVMAVTANLIAEHGVSLIETTDFIITRKAPVDAALPRQGVQPASEIAATTFATVNIPAFATALDRMHQALQARLELDDSGRRLELTEAGRDLAERAAALASLSPAADATPAESPIAQVSAYLQLAEGTVKLADSRRASIRRYRDDLRSLEAMIEKEIDKGWKVLGRIVARQSLVDLSRDLQAIESNSAALNAASYREPTGLEALRRSEEDFGARLQKSREGLRRSQGPQWEQQLTAGFEKLTSARKSAVAADQKIRGATVQLGQQRDAIAASVEQMGESMRSALPDSGKMAAPPLRATSPAVTGSAVSPEERVERHVSRAIAPEERQYRNWVVGITVAVLACILAITISTIESIVRPVRSLIAAARQLGEGKEVRVSRGGIRELDDLAVEFDRMAGQLASARASLLAHQQHLEERVQERTVALKHLAEHDSLTELPNRRLLLERLDAALHSAAAAGENVGVYFLDLDNFKNINDSMGHEFGDLVLLSVSQRIAEVTASFGFAGRLGGDEFTILYPAAASYQAVAEMGEHILRAFQRPVRVGDRELTLSTSLGISVFPDHGREPEVLLRAADAALFRAKALGRNQLHLFSPELVELAHTKFVIEQGLRRALDQGEFEMVYQPEVDVATLEPVMVEALLRWRTPDGVLLSPDAFLAVAEESGLIADVSDWVLRTAIAAAADWHRGAWPAVRIAINVSPRQLVDTRFVNRVQELLRQHNLPPHCIELELTENLLQTGASTIEALRRLRAEGIAIALDDFGTGYSSFASLEVLPLTRVKLDRSLIASVDSNSPAAAIASSIIGLCRSLGFQITAEGVERPEQLAMLMEQGATHVQGYLLSRPVAHDDLIAELEVMKERMVSILLSLPRAAGTTPDRVEPASAKRQQGAA